MLEKYDFIPFGTILHPILAPKYIDGGPIKLCFIGKYLWISLTCCFAFSPITKQSSTITEHIHNMLIHMISLYPSFINLDLLGTVGILLIPYMILNDF